jgi:hypothetical protein
MAKKPEDIDYKVDYKTCLKLPKILAAQDQLRTAHDEMLFVSIRKKQPHAEEEKMGLRLRGGTVR